MDQKKDQALKKVPSRMAGKAAETQQGNEFAFLLNPRTIGLCLLVLLVLLFFNKAFFQNPLEGTGAAEAAPDSPDQSFTDAEFQKLGMPDVERAWTADDMAQARDVLIAVSKKGFEHLPRFRSNRSGAVFARLATMDNLQPYTDAKLPLQTRFTGANQFLGPVNQILELYFTGQSQRKVRVSEVVELMGLQLRLAKMNADLIEEFLPTLDKTDPTYPKRMEGLEEVKRGIAGLILGVFAYMTEGKRDRLPALKRLVAVMQETIPALFARITRSSQETCLARLDKLIDLPRLHDLQPDLGALRKKMVAGQRAKPAAADGSSVPAKS